MVCVNPFKHKASTCEIVCHIPNGHRQGNLEEDLILNDTESGGRHFLRLHFELKAQFPRIMASFPLSHILK